MPRRYNLRKRDKNVKWIEDETLKDKEDESESEDEDYVPPSVSESEEDAEDEEESEDESSKRAFTAKPSTLHLRDVKEEKKTRVEQARKKAFYFEDISAILDIDIGSKIANCERIFRFNRIFDFFN